MDNHRYVTPRAGFYQAQHGEDAWPERYFKGKQRGYFVDVGAYDGLVLSNSTTSRGRSHADPRAEFPRSHGYVMRAGACGSPVRRPRLC